MVFFGEFMKPGASFIFGVGMGDPILLRFAAPDFARGVTFPDELVELHFGYSFNRCLVEISSEVEHIFDLFKWMSIYDSHFFWS